MPVFLVSIFYEPAEHPQQGMNPENGKGADQQRGHADKRIEEDREFMSIRWFSMGIEFRERDRCAFMAFRAGLEEISRVDT